MKSATVHRLHPNNTARQDRKPGVVETFDVADDNPESTPQGIVASILAQTANLISSQGEREQTQRNAILAFGVRCLSAGLLYLSQIVLARWMGGFQYGIYVFVWTWVLILGGLAHLGLNVTAIRLTPVYRETGEIDKLRGLIRGARMIAFGSGTIIMLLGVAGIWFFKPYIESYYVLPMYLALVCVPLFALTDVQDGIGVDATLCPTAASRIGVHVCCPRGRPPHGSNNRRRSRYRGDMGLRHRSDSDHQQAA